MRGQTTNKLIQSVGVFLVVLLTACASQPPTVTTVANKDPDYTKRIQRVVVVAVNKDRKQNPNPSFGRVNPRFTPIWGTLAASLRARGLQVDIVIPEPLELEKGKTARDAIAKLGATHVITLESTRGNYVSGFRAQRYESQEYESTVIDVASRKTVWRASTRIESSVLLDEDIDEYVPAAILEKLKIDGLI